MLMKTKKTYHLRYDCLKNCYLCNVHVFNYLRGELVSEIFQPPFRASTLRDALEYFRTEWNVGYNRINFDGLDNLLKKL